MLGTLITSKTRVNLLRKFFLNSNNASWLRSLESEFEETSNAIRLELIRLEKAMLLVSNMEGNKKIFRANINHPLYPEINSLIMKHFGLDEVIDRFTRKVGNLEAVYLVGDLAKGIDSKMIDLWVIGQNIDKTYLLKVIEKIESKINRKIRYIVINNDELNEFLTNKNKDEFLLLWKED